jgi:hypothetical protein
MRVVLVVALAVVAAAPSVAHAQSAQQSYFGFPPPIAPTDMANYCVFDNRIYSLGSGLCLGRTGYTCVPPTGPTTGNRAFWTGKDDQVFTRPQCP